MASTLKLPGIVKVSPGLRYWSEVGLPRPSTSRTGPGSTILCLVGVPPAKSWLVILLPTIDVTWKVPVNRTVSPTLIEELVEFPFWDPGSRSLKWI